MSFNPITKPQIQQLHILLNQTKQLPYKQDLMDTVCIDGRYPTSSKDLYEVEAKTLIRRLQTMKEKQQNSENTMRRKVIACLREAGYNKAGVADMARIYEWVNKYGHAKKELNKYDYLELVKLVTQAELFKKSHLEGLGK